MKHGTQYEIRKAVNSNNNFATDVIIIFDDENVWTFLHFIVFNDTEFLEEMVQVGELEDFEFAHIEIESKPVNLSKRTSENKEVLDTLTVALQEF